ncbi:hypothetical protein TrST_g2215 [Triparma strigata]|uniref:Uncharacterized protein n=1 Tax=Triparma strigata TaxID=1606541 RepID=A0A9W6ZLK1_9STRA|nr:hypothetical protein TrST_g2215 [Triparma strigata]
MSGFNYSKWDGIDTDDSDDDVGNVSAISTSSKQSPLADIFDRAAGLYNKDRVRECLSLYKDFLASGLKIAPSHHLPTRSAKAADGVVLPPNVLLRLYINVGACHFQLGEFNDAHRFASQGGVELLRDNGWMEKATSKLPLPLLLLRARAFQLSAASLLSIGTESLRESSSQNVNKVNKVRPMLLRAKGDFKQAAEFCEALDSTFEGAVELKREVLQGASKLDSLLKEHFTSKSAFKPRNNSSSAEVVEEMLKEVRVRLQKKQYSAAETSVNFILSKNIGREVQAKALLLKCRALEMAGKLSQSAVVLEEAGGILGSSEKPKAFRKAGLTYLRVRDFENAKRCFGRALEELEKRENPVSDGGEDVFELDGEGNIVAEGGKTSPAPPQNKVSSIVANLTNLAGIQCTTKAYGDALDTIGRALQLLEGAEDGRESQMMKLAAEEVLSDALAGSGDFVSAATSARSVCALAESLEEWSRCAASFLSLGHMQRFVEAEDRTTSSCFEKAAEMYERGGELEQVGKTFLTEANVLKQTAKAREEKEKVVEVLKKAAEAFKNGRKKGSNLGCLRGEFEACRAIAFCYRSYFDFDSGDSVDIDLVIEYFARCRAVAAVMGRGGEIAGDQGRVSFEWANALKKRGAEGDLPRAEVGFEDALKQFRAEGKAKEAEIAEEMLKRLRKK